MALALLETAGTVLLLGVALFASAGTLRWPMAWAFLLLYVAIAATALLSVGRPLVEERSRLLAQGERDDVVLSIAFALFLFPGLMVACGLDRRFGATPALPFALQVASFVVFVAGYGFGVWAMRANPFFTTVVRIQSERGHRVVDQGPYRWIRHPGYAGALAAHLALPVALGTLWGLVPAVIGALLLALRIVREERTLRGGLAGYPAYASRVRWRLVPGVW